MVKCIFNVPPPSPMLMTFSSKGWKALMMDCSKRYVQSKILCSVHSRRHQIFFYAVQVSILHLKEWTHSHKGLAQVCGFELCVSRLRQSFSVTAILIAKLIQMTSGFYFWWGKKQQGKSKRNNLIFFLLAFSK